jgi:hypothetical protein
MQYEPAARPVSGAPTAYRRPSGTTDIAARRARPFTIKTSYVALPVDLVGATGFEPVTPRLNPGYVGVSLEKGT